MGPDDRAQMGRAVVAMVMRDLEVDCRRPWRRMYRIGAFVILAVILWMVLGFVSRLPAPVVGADIVGFSALMVLGMALALMRTSRLTGTMSRDDDSQVLGLLLMSDLGPRGIVWYRLLRAWGEGLGRLLMLLPLMAWCGSFGRISIAQVFVGWLVCACLRFAMTGLSLPAASVFREPTKTEYAGNGLAVGLLVVPLVLIAFGSVGMLPFPGLKELLSPPLAAISVVRGQNLGWCLVGCGISVVLGLLGGLVAGPLLQRRLVGKARQPLRQVARDWWRRVTWRRKPAIAGDPVAWREFHVVLGGWRRVFFLVGIFAVATFVVPNVLIFLFEQRPGVGTILTELLFFAGINAMLGLLVPIWLAAESFFQERQQGTLEMLLVTSLEDRELAVGKLRGIALATSPMLVFTFLSWLYLVIVMSKPEAWFVGLPLGMVGALTWMSMILATVRQSLTHRGKTKTMSAEPLLVSLLGAIVLFPVMGILGAVLDSGLTVAAIGYVGLLAILVANVFLLNFYWGRLTTNLRQDVRKAEERKFRKRGKRTPDDILFGWMGLGKKGK